MKHSLLSAEEKRKANARSYLHTYVKRGKIQKKSCCICGEPNTEAHHSDYDKPLEVSWLCMRCHKRHHAFIKSLRLPTP